MLRYFNQWSVEQLFLSLQYNKLKKSLSFAFLLQIQFCTCNKRFTSPPEIPEGQESSKSCRSCGGILSVVELGGLSRRMWSTVGPEFAGVIDPQLKWKTSSNGKHRALRRARTFTQDNGKKFIAKNTEDIEDLFDEASKKEGHMLVSESEKFGVSVLGRRFSDNLESVPIKKRRFSLLPPQSTPHILSSSGFHDYNHGGRFALVQNNQVSLKQDESGIYSSHGGDWGQEKSSADEKRSLEDIDEHVGDSADFSGISILAAAACYSSIEKGFMDVKGPPTIRGRSFEENPSSLRFSESIEGKDQPSKPELGNKPKPSVVSVIAGEALCREPGQIKFDERKEENSNGTLQKFSSKRKSAASRDDRLHWDLNTVMDVWENQPDDFSNSDPLDNVKSNGSRDMECGNQGLGQVGTVFGINKAGLIVADNKDISHSFHEIDRKHANPVADCDEGKHGLPKTQVCEPLQEECQFKDAEVILSNVPEKTNHVGSGEKSCDVTRIDCPIEGFAHLDRDLSTKVVDLSDEEKYTTDNVNFSVEADTHNTLPCLVIYGNINLDRTVDVCNPFSEDKNVNEMLHVDSISITTVDSCNAHSGECHPAHVGKSNQLRSPRAEKHQSVSADVALSITAPPKSPAGQLDQNTSGIIIHGDEKTFQVSLDGSSSKRMTTYGCLADETACNDEFGKAYATGNQSTVLFNSKGTSDNEQFLPRIACINHSKGTSADLKVDDYKSCILSDESLNASTVPFHASSKLTNSISEGLMLERNDIPLADDILISHRECKTPADDHVRHSVKDSLEEHCDSEHYSDACPIDSDYANGLEKVEFLGDDDSQYEDGELRESVLNSWGEDGVEEVETEHVDYGSDCRDADIFEAESDFCSQSDLAVGSTECKHEGKFVSTFGDENILRVTEDDSQSKFQKHFLIKDVSNVSYCEGDARKNLDVSVVSEMSARDENRLLTSNIPTDVSDVTVKSIHPDSSRMKSSGWDKLPRREDAAVDSLWNCDGASAARSVNGEYARRMVVSPVKRDSSSRVERSKSSEASCRKEVSYTMENKKLDHIDLNAERSTNASRSIGRSRLPFRSHGRGRADCWVGSPDNHGSCRFDTSGYYSSPKFAPPGSRNAAAAAVAKVESNGFVVAPDGTIVKAGGMGSGSHLSIRSSNSSTHLQSTRRGSTMESDGAFDMSSEPSNSTREVSPDRCFNVGRGRASRHGSRFISLGHRNMYHAPTLDRRIDSLSLQHPSSRRQRSFSPHRRPIHLSREHTRSPSRSKTRSPHTWTSPRGRDDGRISGVPDVRRQSRSPPNFKTQRRIPRQRSPQRRVIAAEELAAYAPSSRSHSSPPHASRWFDNERILQGHLREHQPRCPTGRNSPARIFSQNDRLDHIDSRGRVKPDEYYQPIYSGRFHEHAGYGRGSKHESRDDGRRGKSNRYELLPSEGHLESNGNMKSLRYGDNGIRVHNLQPKSSGFQRRESPRTFDRSVDTQRKDSPRRIKGEMVHFRRSRDGKLNTDLSFGVGDTSDAMALQRRPS